MFNIIKKRRGTLMEGKLSDISFAELIGKIYIKNLSGIITLNWDELWKLIYIQSGKLQFVVSNQEEENLLEFLLSIEAITKEGVDKVRQIIDSKSIYLGIKESGIISEEELTNYNDMLCKGIIFSLFNWVLGTFSFREAKANRLDYNLNYSVPEVIFEGTRRISDFPLIKLRIGKYNHLLSLSESFYNEAKNLPLTPSETFIISRIGEKTSIKELIDMTMLDEEEVCRCIYALKCCGFISITPVDEVPPPPILEKPRRSYEEYRFIESTKEFAKKIPELKDYEILGLEPSFDFDSLLSNFEELSEKYNPDKYTSPTYSDIKEELAFISDQILKAYIRLRALSIAKPSITKDTNIAEAEKRNFYSYFTDKGEHLTPEEINKEIQQYFIKAKEAAEIGDYFTAVQNCEKAIAFDQNNAELYLFLAKIYSELPRFINKAIETYSKYLELKPSDTQSRLKLAKLLLKASNPSNAMNELLKIIEIEPDNEEAKYLLSQLPT
jgi:hypothetical protein